MKIHPELSQRIDFIRFPLIVGVVFIHANVIAVNFADGSSGINQMGKLPTFVRDYFSNVLFRVAVPLFFIISGYLFFITYRNTWSGYVSKIRSRIKTLLIPILFWNILTLCIMALAQSIPATSVLFSGDKSPISSYSVFDYFNAIFGLNQLPVAGQFWFIRDLFVMVLFTPLIYVMIRWIPFIVIPGLLACWYFYFWPLPFPTIPAVTFFVIGGYLGLKEFNFCSLDRYGKFLLPVYICISLVDLLTKGEAYNNLIHNAGLLTGLTVAFFTVRYMQRIGPLNRLVVWATPASFFVFAFHEPFQLILRKTLYRILHPETEISVLLLYFGIPILVLAIGLSLYFILMKLSPRGVKIIAGGR